MAQPSTDDQQYDDDLQSENSSYNSLPRRKTTQGFVCKKTLIKSASCLFDFGLSHAFSPETYID